MINCIVGFPIGYRHIHKQMHFITVLTYTNTNTNTISLNTEAPHKRYSKQNSGAAIYTMYI